MLGWGLEWEVGFICACDQRFPSCKAGKTYCIYDNLVKNIADYLGYHDLPIYLAE